MGFSEFPLETIHFSTLLSIWNHLNRIFESEFPLQTIHGVPPWKPPYLPRRRDASWALNDVSGASHPGCCEFARTILVGNDGHNVRVAGWRFNGRSAGPRLKTTGLENKNTHKWNMLHIFKMHVAKMEHNIQNNRGIQLQIFENAIIYCNVPSQ